MQLQDIQFYRTLCKEKQIIYHTDIFTKFIWGDMGEDTASISIQIIDNHWHMHFIRTQSGEPSYNSGFMCNVIDQYERMWNDNELYTYLLDRSLCDEFEAFMKPYTEKDVSN